MLSLFPGKGWGQCGDNGTFLGGAGQSGTINFNSCNWDDDNYFADCSGFSGRDDVYRLTVPSGATVTIQQTSNTYDSYHMLRYGATCGSTTLINCVDDPDTQVNTWVNNTGSTQTVWWWLGGYASQCGSGTFTWSVTSPCAPPAPPGFGINTWNVLGYEHGGYNYGNIGSLAGNTFKGYYTDATVDINSQARWISDGTPSSASGWVGCPVSVDNHTVVYKRQGFPTAFYQIDLNGHDDGVQCYVNGSLVYGIDGCCADRGVIWSGILCSSSTVEFRVMEGGGGSNLTVDFIDSPYTAGTISGTPTLCPGATSNFTTNGNTGGTWTTSNALVATVNPSTGLVTAIGSGSATITYTVSNAQCGNVSANFNINVNSPTAPTTSGTSISCGQTATLTASGAPSGGSYVWYSDGAGANQVGTGTSFTTPVLSSNTTYYVGSSVSGGSPSCNTSSLANILSSLNSNQGTISAAVTNGYNFSMDAGLNSTYIFDGGNDMYDGGNYVSTNLATNIAYSDGVVASSGAFGAGSSYFTRKINNMWVLTANMNNVSNFIISGNNGADGGGSVNGATLSATVGCQQYTLLLKRVWNAGDPSINQMVIIPSTLGVSHTWSANTDNSYHEISGLNGVTRMYYLLYASANGGYLDDNTAINIATTFLNQVSATISVPNLCISSLTPAVVTVNPLPGPVVSGSTQLCGSGSTTLTATGTGNTIEWYADAAGTQLISSGNTLTTPVLTANTTYYVREVGSSSGSQTFNYTGEVQTFTAPAAGTYTLDVYGARGGNVTSHYPTNGGLGGRSQGTITLTAGQVVYVYVGGQGADLLGNHPYGNCTLTPGGWNGGGANRSQGNGTPGGGASDIRIGGQGLANRIIVAGGGGGCGWYYAAGGAGGGLTGGAGTNHGSGGATQAAGGAVGSSAASCVKSAGTLGQGGDGSGYSAGGGGGGGGYYGGGGGGYDQGGGGGSSYIGGVTNGTTTAGVRNGNGQVIVSWSGTGCASALIPVTVTLNTAPTAPTGISGTTIICSGSTTTLTATGGSVGSGATYEWGTGSTIGSNIISGATGVSYTTPALSANTTYWVRLVGNTACSNTTSGVTIPVTVNNPTLATAPTNGDMVWRGASSDDWLTTANWWQYNGTSYAAASAAPTTAQNVIIPANQTCVVNQPNTNANAGSAKNLRIESGATLTMTTGSLTVTENWVNNGSFVPGSGTVTFAGSETHTISGTASTHNFNNLTMNKTGEVQLLGPIAMSGALTLTNGRLNIGNFNLDLPTNTINGGNANSYVRTSGTGVLMRDVGASMVNFPVGRTAYNPAALTNSGVADKFSVRVIDNVTDNGDNADTDPTTTMAVVNRTWMVDEQTAGGSNVALRLNWNGAGEQINGFQGANAFIAHYFTSEGLWDNIGGTVPSLNVIETSGITSFSPFTISSDNAFAPLPVELIYFTAHCQNDDVEVKWSTASEHNSQYFTLQVSEDGMNWSNLYVAQGAGFSNTVVEYSYAHKNAARAKNYYRLLQYDYDGAVETYSTIMSNCSSDDAVFMTFPNPSADAFTIVVNDELLNGANTLTISDASGKVIYSIAVELENGSGSFALQGLDLPAGLYYLQLNNGSHTSRVIKHSFR